METSSSSPWNFARASRPPLPKRPRALDRVEPGVVPGSAVLQAGIAESDDELHVRRGRAQEPAPSFSLRAVSTSGLAADGDAAASPSAASVTNSRWATRASLAVIGVAAGRHGEIGDGEGLARHLLEIDADLLGDVADLAADLDLVERVGEHHAGLRRRGGSADEVQVDLHFDLLIEVHPREVEVDDVVAEVTELQVLDEAGLLAVSGGDVEDVDALMQVAERLLRVEGHRDRLLAVAVDDCGKAAGGAEPLRVAAAEPVANVGFKGRGLVAHRRKLLW